MSYPRQDSVMRRLQAENTRALDKVKAGHRALLQDRWERAAASLRDDVYTAYKMSARDGAWSLPQFHGSGAYHRLAARAGHVLAVFRDQAARHMKMALKEIKAQSTLRHAWALDQVTPVSTSVRTPTDRQLHEAEVPLASDWGERWTEWVSAYHSALMSNLRLNALNEGGLEDAVAEVAATRANTPAYTLDSALQRIFDYEAEAAVAAGEDDVASLNGDAVDAEIWRTRGDLRVCDDCDANEGLGAEEVDGDIPLHPNCNCFWQVVPASFAALLRSGDQADRDLAAQMDYEGLAPNAMIIRGADGEIAGKTIVDFDSWSASQGLAVSGGVP